MSQEELYLLAKNAVYSSRSSQNTALHLNRQYFPQSPLWKPQLHNRKFLVGSPVAARSKAWTIFALLTTGVVGSNPTRGMDVCARLFCICVVLCVSSGLEMGWSLVQGVLPTVYRIKKLKKRLRSNRRATEPQTDGWMDGWMDREW
jgi:hypothetical protein